MDWFETLGIIKQVFIDCHLAVEDNKINAEVVVVILSVNKDQAGNKSKGFSEGLSPLQNCQKVLPSLLFLFHPPPSAFSFQNQHLSVDDIPSLTFPGCILPNWLVSLLQYLLSCNHRLSMSPSPTEIYLIFYNFIYFYFWLHWVFVGPSLVVASGGYSLLPCMSFSLGCLLLWWNPGSRHMSFNNWSIVVVAQGFLALKHVESSWTRNQIRVPCHWQADSYPLHHQRSSQLKFIYINLNLQCDSIRRWGFGR